MLPPGRQFTAVSLFREKTALDHRPGSRNDNKAKAPLNFERGFPVGHCRPIGFVASAVLVLISLLGGLVPLSDDLDAYGITPGRLAALAGIRTPAALALPGF